ncbi:hypothetical protein CYMTET_11042 [Cymbomonas tetramitiformis]|uniref:Uncharacterized protein n=1 Tax=Cymbomonas tetramitiformis TaxID=36881 RepID=A0AAE0GN45_9CHLO|nr:hypothetical protein CYMTET_27365 [Cymbomonas tetramitiformis]KAK3281152.1 hypothetical protein CYMTET_11042 [Cymbomonas tetramitiformis]
MKSQLTEWDNLYDDNSGEGRLRRILGPRGDAIHTQRESFVSKGAVFDLLVEVQSKSMRRIAMALNDHAEQHLQRIKPRVEELQRQEDGLKSKFTNHRIGFDFKDLQQVRLPVNAVVIQSIESEYV